MGSLTSDPSKKCQSLFQPLTLIDLIFSRTTGELCAFYPSAEFEICFYPKILQPRCRSSFQNTARLQILLRWVCPLFFPPSEKHDHTETPCFKAKLCLQFAEFGTFPRLTQFWRAALDSEHSALLSGSQAAGVALCWNRHCAKDKSSAKQGWIVIFTFAVWTGRAVCLFPPVSGCVCVPPSLSEDGQVCISGTCTHTLTQKQRQARLPSEGRYSASKIGCVSNFLQALCRLI